MVLGRRYNIFRNSGRFLARTLRYILTVPDYLLPDDEVGVFPFRGGMCLPIDVLKEENGRQGKHMTT